jgi:large subunit ribosomal protein L18e
MSKKIKKTNPLLINLIKELKKKSYENNAPIWKDIAERLEKPSSKWAEVNLYKINRYIRENEIALVPGKVLSTGELTKKTSIAAYAFSEKAREKIKKAGGKCLTIEELMKINPTGKNVRIMG